MAFKDTESGRFIKGREDFTNHRYGRWTVLGFSRIVNSHMSVWRCRCDCGTVKDVRVGYLRQSDNPSCGCRKLEVLRRTRNPNERFDNLTIPVTETGCFIWLGSLSPKGYGQFNPGRKNGKARLVRAHQFAYVRHYGEVPEGLEIDHKCVVRCCVNPNHLEAVTHAENLRRSAVRRKARMAQAGGN